jgi:CHAT domain-containing protein
MDGPSHTRRTTPARLLVLLGLAICISAHAEEVWHAQFRAGVNARQAGNIAESVRALNEALPTAPAGPARVQTLTALGLSLELSGHVEEAERILGQALEQSTPATRPAIVLALGNVAVAAHEPRRAIELYNQLLTPAGDLAAPPDIRVLAQLNLARLQPPRQRIGSLESLYLQIPSIDRPIERTRAYINLGTQAQEALETARLIGTDEEVRAGSEPVTAADRVLKISFQSLTNALELARQSGNAALRIEAFDAMALLYQSQGRYRDALQTVQAALELAEGIPLGQVELLLTRLEFRSGELQQQLGDNSRAMAAYMRASGHLENIRQDLPIEQEDGQSTYLTLIKPLFDRQLDLLLREVDALPPVRQQAQLQSVIAALELTHQAEMQDYLGDRCSVEAIRQRLSTPPDPGVAELYTFVLRDRIDVVIRVSTGLSHRAIPFSSVALDQAINELRAELSDPSSTSLLAAQTLYQRLIAPLEPGFSMAGIRTLVIVPDGQLRLIPFGALHDGQQFLVERFVVSTVTGLSMTERSARAVQPRSLLAGLAEPGPVIGKLLSMGFAGTAADGRVPSESKLRSQLELPGVNAEIERIAVPGKSVALINDRFTVARFEHEVGSGDYQLVHVASHGFFGDSAQQSFLLAYDDVIRLNDLQRLIGGPDGVEEGAIELLTLSACGTAEGDDRAPLGFAGAAIKARAKSVIGSLWAVDDHAEQQMMQVLYANLPQHSKAEALALAQRSMIASAAFSHPSNWAPLVLVGDWN